MTTPAYIKSYPVNDCKARRLWGLDHTYCQVCHIPESMLAVTGQFPSALQTHHIVKAGRSDEPTNLCRLCPRDHRIAEGERVPRGGNEYWPTITLGMILGVKRSEDPEEYDRDRLTVLRRNRARSESYDPLPDEQPLPESYLMERMKWISK